MPYLRTLCTTQMFLKCWNCCRFRWMIDLERKSLEGNQNIIAIKKFRWLKMTRKNDNDDWFNSQHCISAHPLQLSWCEIGELGEAKAEHGPAKSNRWYKESKKIAKSTVATSIDRYCIITIASLNGLLGIEIVQRANRLNVYVRAPASPYALCIACLFARCFGYSLMRSHILEHVAYKSNALNYVLTFRSLPLPLFAVIHT